MTDGSPGGANVTSALRALWEQHSERIFARIENIEEAIVALMEERLDEELREAAVRDAHKLAGSLGTFGFPEGTRIARDVERILEGDEPPEREQAVRLSEFVVALRHTIADDPVFETVGNDDDGEVGGNGRPVILVTEDEELASRLEVDLAGLRFAPTVVREVTEELLKPPPAAMIIDLSGHDPDDFESRLEVVPDETLAAALIDSDEMDHRLAAARAGGRLIFRRSLGSAAMARALSEALDEVRIEEATVLSVDDDESVGVLVKAILEARGLRVEAIQDPTRFLEVLESLDPDLVILDKVMPDVSGIELCRLLRSDPTHATLPVIFLTGADDQDTLEEVFEAGADDFVGKPIVGPALVQRVFNRLERVHLLRKMTEQDSLTGLPNRTTASPAIASLLELARNNGEPLSFALVDLDRIARINARHGFSAGDLPLRRIARLLETEFDREAVVARWSGVTFGLATYGTTAAELRRRLEALGEEFSGQPFEGGDGDSFRVTFSAGIAEHPDDGSEFRELIRVADRVLGEAGEVGPGTIWTTSSGNARDGATERVEVLIVDDDRPIAELLMQSLQTRGIKAKWMGDGKEALQALTSDPPALAARLLVLDIGLPGMDGLSVLRQLAREGLTERMRVMMLTARTAESEVLRALELGAFDHIPKPFSVPIVLHKIRFALEH